MPTNSELLAEYADLMSLHGPDSANCMRFIFDHRKNSKLIELCRLSWFLKKGLADLQDDLDGKAGR